jgi:hypothetical protein
MHLNVVKSVIECLSIDWSPSFSTMSPKQLPRPSLRISLTITFSVSWAPLATNSSDNPCAAPLLSTLLPPSDRKVSMAL